MQNDKVFGDVLLNHVIDIFSKTEYKNISKLNLSNS